MDLLAPRLRCAHPSAPVIVLGGILSGIVTVTEAAALAVSYALFVSTAINRKLKWTAMSTR